MEIRESSRWRVSDNPHGVHQSSSPAPDELEARRRLARKLRRLSRPIVVAIDDIDRMLPEEAAQVFELVARTAGLPQLRYLMSFDRSSLALRLPAGLLNRCISKLEVDLDWGTLRRRPALPLFTDLRPERAGQDNHFLGWPR